MDSLKPELLPPLSAHLPLLKQRSWSPDTERDEAWTKKKALYRNRKGHRVRSMSSVSDEDMEELRGCVDLGFSFEADSPCDKQRLSETLPALDLYFAVHRVSSNNSSKPSMDGSPVQFVSPGDSAENVKAKLKLWAQAVACSVRQRQRC